MIRLPPEVWEEPLKDLPQGGDSVWSVAGGRWTLGTGQRVSEQNRGLGGSRGDVIKAPTRAEAIVSLRIFSKLHSELSKLTLKYARGPYNK